MTRRADFAKIIRDKAFSIIKNTKYDGYQRGLGLMIYYFFDKETSGGAVTDELPQSLATIFRMLIVIS